MVDGARLESVAVERHRAIPSYAEILLTVRFWPIEPGRLVIGVSRDASEPECRRTVEKRLQRRLAKHL